MHYLLIYDLVDDYVTRRAPLRRAHVTYAQQYIERGELLLGGALARPVDRAILLFQGDSPSIAEWFAHHDPYVRGGLVRRWEVREWTTVVGPLAAVSLQPGSL
jgi:uncharacterized protein